MGKNALAAAGLTSFFEFGSALVARLAETIPGGRALPIEFYILDLDSDGAWVVWPAECYGVFITRGLLWKIQKIGWHGMEAMRDGKHIPVKMNFFRELWGDLPDDDEYYIQFGTLIARIAFAFVIHHELAHAGLGHEGARFMSARGSGMSGLEMPLIADADYLDEFASVIDNLKASLRSQALETDADVHGFFYTRQLINDESELLRQRDIAPDSVWPYVCKALLRDAHCRQFMIFTGVAVGLLALLPNLEAERFGETVPTSHPPAPSRLLLMFHVVGSITRYGERFWENRSAAMSCAIVLISLFLRAEGHITMSTQPGSGHATDAVDATATAHEAASSKWQKWRHLAIVDAMFCELEVGQYWEELVAEMRTISPGLRKFARFPEYIRYGWYEAASDETTRAQ